MRRTQASIWLACLFLLWTNAQTTEEVIYRQHYYDHGDDYDHSGQDTDHYYGEPTNGYTDGGYGGHSTLNGMNEWEASAHIGSTTEPEYSHTGSLQDTAASTSKDQSIGPVLAEEYTALTTEDTGVTTIGKPDVSDTSQPLESGTTDEYDEYTQYGTGTLSTNAAPTSEEIEPSGTTTVHTEMSSTEASTKANVIAKSTKTLPPEAGWTEAKSDEDGCDQGQLACDDGTCIDANLICDGKKDCKGGEDEDPSICDAIQEDIFNRTTTRPTDGPKSNLTFVCDDGQKIPLENAYDTIEDCTDGSDESDRGRSEKMSKCFQCEVDGMCLNPKVVCDGVADCANGADEDEINCNYIVEHRGKATTEDVILIEDRMSTEWKGIAPSNLTVKSIEPWKVNGVVLLTCTLGNENMDEALLKNVSWYKDGVPISKVQATDMRYGTYENVLHISNTDEGDYGHYACEAELTNGTMLKSSSMLVRPRAEGPTTTREAAAAAAETVRTSDEPTEGVESTTQTEEFVGESEATQAPHRHTSSTPEMTEVISEEAPYDIPPMMPVPDFETKETEEVTTETTEPGTASTLRTTSVEMWYGTQAVATGEGSTPDTQTSEFSTAYEETEEPLSADLRSIMQRQEPYVMQEEAGEGETLILRCPVPSAIPIETIEEMYWMHDGNKVPMSIHRDDHIGIYELRASTETEGVWDCYMKSGEDSFKLGYNFVQIRADDTSRAEYQPASTERHVALTEKTTGFPTHPVPLPTEKQLIEWITTTEPSYAFRLNAEPSFSHARAGDTVSVSCSADNLPPGVAIYFIKTRPYGLAIGEVSEQHEGSFANYTLTMRGVKPLTAGEYQCIAVTEDRRAVKVDFRIEVADEGEEKPSTVSYPVLPIVQLQVDDVMYPSNQRAEIKCSGVRPEDYHRIKWKFNDMEIAVDDSAYQMDGNLLFVRRMGPQYAGIYSCSAAGSSSATYQPAFGKLLLQTDKFIPSFETHPEEGHDVQSKSISQGDALTIDCFSRYPAISYTWYQLKDGEEIPMGNEQQLHIPFVHEVGSATYVCRVNTEYGEIKGTVVSVSVAAKALEEQESFTSWIEPQSQDVISGTTVYLTCRCSKPFRSLTWERKSEDGSTAQVGNEPTLIISSAGPTDAGQYTCSVVSDDGDFARSTAHLTIQPPRPVDSSLVYREIKRCGVDEATCRDGTCIKRNLICDGKADCPDGTDEKGCGGAGPQDGECHPDQIMCASDRKCVQKIWLCDGENDCEDGSDEAPRYCAMMPAGTSRACKPSEFQCKTTNFTQCIPRSYVCDESIDCPDQSDEIGCVKPTVTNPPESEKQVNIGETLILRCTARGTPLPFINWRLNWGFICGDGYDNGRCIMAHEFDSRYPDVVVGVLTVRNMQPSDAGAYSCEAINNKGFHFAVPDAFVQVRGQIVPQKCHAFGTAREENGLCRCKINVLGPTCAECKPGYYNLAPGNLHGCISCFCSGVSKQCAAESSLFETVFVDLGDAGQTWQVVHENYPENPWISPDVLYSPLEKSVGVASLQSAPYGPLYWQPSAVQVFPLGNLIRSYGGNLVIKLRKVGDNSPLYVQGPLVWIRGNKIDLVNTTRAMIHPQNGVFTIPIRLDEGSFTRLDGSPTDRAHIMMALANVDKFWIYAGQGRSTQVPLTIVSVSLEVASPSGTGRAATSVEKCSCPMQYTGSSCERCAQGYTRHEGVGLYLGECYSCREHCHGKTDSCHPETGECYNCADNSAGSRCELCVAGYHLNPLTGQCEPAQLEGAQAIPPRILIDDIEYKPPRKISILVRPGERRLIRVISKDVPVTPSSVWLRVEQSGQRVPLPYGMRQDGYDLLIESAAPHMLGEYEARLTLLDGQVITPVILLDYDREVTRMRPTLEPHGIVRKMLNEDIILSVNLNGFPASRIVWTKDHQQLPAQVTQELQRLIIHRLSPELCGTYEATLFPDLPLQPTVLQTTIECVPAPAGVGEPEMAYGPPKITLLPSEVNLAEGQTMVVTYEIVGEQPVDIVWKKLEDGSVLDMPPSFSILRDRVVLNDSRIEDTGIYRVEATNRFGRDEALLRLIVKTGTLPKSFGAAEPQVHFERTVYEVSSGERVHILPRIQSSAAYHVRWTDGNGDPLPEGVYSDGDGLLIQSMVENLAGSYVIEVTTSDARVRVPVEIVVVRQPEQQHHVQQSIPRDHGTRFDLSLPPQLSVEAGGSFEVKCEVSGIDDRQLVFSWKKHGHEGAEPLPSNVQADGPILRGSNVQPSDYAYYMCQAESPHTGQQAVAYTLLNVQNRKVRPVARIFPTNSVQVSLGETASFTCYAQEGEPTPTAAWSRVDGRPIVAPSRSYNGQLDLIGISNSDAGQYRCLLTNEAGQDEAIASVQIEAPPEIRLMINPEELPDMVDETPVYVQCIASGTPTPLVYWTHDGKNVTSADLGYSLVLIRPSTLSGRNIFECVAVNAHDKKTRRIVANVLTRGANTVHHSEIDGNGLHITIRPSEPHVGDDLLLSCFLSDGPPLSRPATYTWAKDGHHLITNMNLERFDIHFIKQATEHDAGNYQCTVSDGVRQVGTTTFALVLRGKTNSPSVEQRNAVEGGTVELNCKQRMTPVLRVHWSRQGGQLPPASSVINGMLRIENIQPQDSGTYICTSWDGEKIYEDYFNLTVNIATLMADSPRSTSPLVTVVTNPTTFAYGAKVTLQCSVYSKEPFMYSWLKDGRPSLRSGVSVQGSEISLYVQHSDLGIYTCDVARPGQRDIAGSASIEMVADPVRIGLVNVVSAEKPTVVHLPTRTNGDKARRPVLIKIRPLQGDYHLNGQVGFECDTSATNAVIRWERRAPTILMSSSARTEMNRVMFERFTHGDTGEYVCIVEKNGQIHEKILHLDIDLSNEDVLFTYPEHPLVISHGAPNINVTFLNPPSEFKRGGNIEVECIVSGQRDAPISWTREHKNMSSNTFIRKNILKFHNFLEHNLGEYRCSARTSVGELSKIVVFEPESFPGISMNASRHKMKIDFQFLSSRSDFRAGGHVVVECVTSDPHARVTWRKLGRPASPGMRIKDRFLIISPFSSDDLGTYECKAFSRLGAVARSIEFDKHDLSANVLPVNEDVLPNIEMKMNDKNVYEVGGKIEITCEVSNDPTARVNWHRGDRKQLGPRTESRDNTLRFHDVSPEDAGVYSCFATNTYGSKYISFEVQISPDGKVHIVNEQENTIPITRTRIPLITEFLTPLSQFKKGGEITIICYFANDMPGRIEWNKVSDDLRRILPLQSSAQIMGSKLRFSSFDQNDLGSYQCTGYGEHGLMKKVVKIDADTFSVLKRLPQRYNQMESEDLQIVVTGNEIGQRVKLWCKMGSARLAVKWEFDGGNLPDDKDIVQIGTRLLFNKFLPRHHGIYTCRARYNGTKLLKHIDTRMYIKNTGENGNAKWLLF